ncbi:MAG: NIPSNAP family protein [Dehalococcoidales bacterium]|nr:NIPSNAP family protein [Dehalococcoidales bacterium]
MIYVEASIRVVPGKMNEFMEVFEKEFLPSSNKLGRKLVAQWRTTIGTLDEITDLWAYDDLTHMQRFQEAKAKSPEFTKASEHLRALIAFETTRLMVPTPLSSMK